MVLLRACFQLDRRLVHLRGREVALHLRALAPQRLQLDFLVGDLVLLLLGVDVGDELVARERLVLVGLFLRGLGPRRLQAHLAIGLRDLVLQVPHALARLLDLLRAQVAQLRLFLFQDLAPALHLQGDSRAGRTARAARALEGDLGHRCAGHDLVAFLDEQLGDAPGVGDQDARGAGIEGEEAFDPLPALVLAPEGHRDEQQGHARGQDGEDPEGHGARDGGFAQVFLALGVDRFLSEKLSWHGGNGL